MHSAATNPALYGHQQVESLLLQKMKAGRLPHALLITGPRGVGKATLGYRLARHLLAGKPTEEAGLFGDSGPATLEMSEHDPVFGRVANKSHSDFFVLQGGHDHGKDINVAATREVPKFLSLTPGESRWRVVLIDSADALNPNAANALLKTLEEPPSNTLLMLISHNPGTLLPTIRSRCQHLGLAPLTLEDFQQILQAELGELDADTQKALHILSGGSPGQAIWLYQHESIAFYDELSGLVAELHDARCKPALLSFAERFAGKDNDTTWQNWQLLWPLLLTRILEQSHRRLNHALSHDEPLALAASLEHQPAPFWLDLWEESLQRQQETNHKYLDRKQTVLTLLLKAQGSIN